MFVFDVANRELESLSIQLDLQDSQIVQIDEALYVLKTFFNTRV